VVHGPLPSLVPPKKACVAQTKTRSLFRRDNVLQFQRYRCTESYLISPPRKGRGLVPILLASSRCPSPPPRSMVGDLTHQQFVGRSFLRFFEPAGSKIKSIQIYILSDDVLSKVFRYILCHDVLSKACVTARHLQLAISISLRFLFFLLCLLPVSFFPQAGSTCTSTCRWLPRDLPA
jgi:hypothetical protein